LHNKLIFILLRSLTPKPPFFLVLRLMSIWLNNIYFSHYHLVKRIFSLFCPFFNHYFW
jgi:hypothetical protein